MSYPPPPGLDAAVKIGGPTASSGTARAHHGSLPPRPPAAAGPPPPPASFQPTLVSGPSLSMGMGAPGTGSSSSWPNPGMAGGAASFSAPAMNAANTTHYAGAHAEAYYPASAQAGYGAAATSTPQIRNPFPLPGHEASSTAGSGLGRGPGAGRYADPGVDPELEAQMAQWQSAYMAKDHADPSASHRSGGGGRRAPAMTGEGPASASGANAGPVGARMDTSSAAGNTATTTTSTTSTTAAAATAESDHGPTAADAKEQTVVRTGGGQTWTDASLLEWDPAHFRLFVGNLAGEVTDESLLKAFARYGSVQRARVVRDKRTTKSRGYGFVSFRDGDEYFAAAREMQGKYIGSHPVLLRRSTTEIRPVAPAAAAAGHKKKKNNHNHNHGGAGKRLGAAAKAGVGPGLAGAPGAGAGGGGGEARTGAGVQKKAHKNKGGMRVLG
ncbi:MAG: hypothetical protein M1826_000447 [Phylliscum demangeonii]|nr:MAG: hypothetical protein M1826_000447 [Phylliscum demangeonii]